MMMEEALQKLMSQHTAQAVCYTLLHSLWHGMAAALLTMVVMVLTKNASAALRYRLLSVVFVVFFTAFLFTLTLELYGNAANIGSSQALDPFSYFLKYSYEHAGTIAGIWMLLVVLKVFRLLFSLYTIHRFKTKRVQDLNIYWSERLAILANSIGIAKTIRLLESGLANVPLMIGYLKPVILVPIGLVNQLQPEEVEAILLHELAHIRRNDHLMNFLQHLAETLLFFNPALLWLSSLINTERENCCDDVAMSASVNKLTYVRAMVHFQEQAARQPAHTLAFSGKRGGLLLRIERLVTNNNRSLNRLEVFSISLLFLLSVMFVAIRPQTSYQSLIKGGNGPKQEQAKKKAEAEASRRSRAHP
jgi:bla regulator protein BlaR1